MQKNLNFLIGIKGNWGRDSDGRIVFVDTEDKSFFYPDRSCGSVNTLEKLLWDLSDARWAADREAYNWLKSHIQAIHTFNRTSSFLLGRFIAGSLLKYRYDCDSISMSDQRIFADLSKVDDDLGLFCRASRR